MKRDELELAGRIIPKAKHRDNVGSNSPPLGAYFLLDTPLLVMRLRFWKRSAPESASRIIL